MAHPPFRTSPMLGLEGVRMGTLVELSPERGLLVDFEGNLNGPLPARLLIPLSAQALQEALAQHTPAALLFEPGDPWSPLVVGLLQPLPPEVLPVQAECGENSPTTPAVSEQTSASGMAEAQLPLLQGPLEIRVEEQRIVLEARTELVLQCGPASITLQPDGRVLIRGTDVISHARGLQRLRGAAIQLN